MMRDLFNLLNTEFEDVVVVMPVTDTLGEKAHLGVMDEILKE